ncbi:MULTISPECIES: Bug family tripartite tricarboxylate transporter substrate binding protein [Polaromonas]|uniref:Bug family tripartite tricarboxylate transporter substrate binding protein n=1 Tax=Polaromonas aquatica TaxID=332657 RepID=A0ABW1U5W0_9BURK
MKRSIHASFIAFLMSVFVLSANAQGFPSRTVSIIVPFPPGGSADLFARAIAPILSKTWGQPVIVENRPGAGGNIAAQMAARATPDGHTLFLAPDPVLSTNQLIYPKLPYDVKRDFAPVSRVVEFPSVIVVNASLGVKTLGELQTLAKTNQGKLNFSSFGIGTAPHIGMEMFNRVAGVDIVHVPYKGMADAVPALVAGDVQVLFIGHSIAQMGAIQEGRLRILAVAGDHRSRLIPNVPTFAEAGFPTLKGPNFWGFVTQSKVPRAIIEKINADIVKALSDPGIVDRFVTKNGYELIGDTPEQFAARIQALTDIWAPVIKSADIHLE